MLHGVLNLELTAGEVLTRAVGAAPRRESRRGRLSYRYFFAMMGLSLSQATRSPQGRHSSNLFQCVLWLMRDDRLYAVVVKIYPLSQEHCRLTKAEKYPDPNVNCIHVHLDWFTARDSIGQAGCCEAMIFSNPQ